MNNCIICNKKVNRKYAIVCSIKCNGKYQSIRMKALRPIRYCPICNKLITTTCKTCSKKCGYILSQQTYKDTCLKRYGIKNISQLQSVKNKKAVKGYWFSTNAGKEFIIKNNKTRKISKPNITLICKRKKCQTKFIVPYYFRNRLYCSKKCSLWDNRHGNSNIEIQVAKILDKFNIKYIREYKIENGQFDFYLINHNILIEVNGNYWHGKNLKFDKMNKIQKGVHLKDIIKNKIAKRNNYILYRVWEDEVNENNIRRILNEQQNYKYTITK